MKTLFFLSTIFLLSSCSRNKVWLVESWQNGGIIGYEGTSRVSHSEVAGVVPCRNFTITNHVLVSNYMSDWVLKGDERHYRRDGRQPASVDSYYNNSRYYDYRPPDAENRGEITYSCYRPSHLDGGVDHYRSYNREGSYYRRYRRQYYTDE
jgi:hypothetical protein